MYTHFNHFILLLLQYKNQQLIYIKNNLIICSTIFHLYSLIFLSNFHSIVFILFLIFLNRFQDFKYVFIFNPKIIIIVILLLF